MHNCNDKYVDDVEEAPNDPGQEHAAAGLDDAYNEHNREDDLDTALGDDGDGHIMRIDESLFVLFVKFGVLVPRCGDHEVVTEYREPSNHD